MTTIEIIIKVKKPLKLLKELNKAIDSMTEEELDSISEIFGLIASLEKIE